jgi:predicted RNase H-like HicB family nuclease
MIPVRHKGCTYSLTVERHERGYFGYFPALPGCHGWGATYGAAVKAAEDALIPYLQIQPQHGDRILEEKSPVSLAEWIRAFSIRRVHLHTVTTTVAMVTCIAIILNLGPFSRNPKIDSVVPGREAVGSALQQPNQPPKSRAEPEQIPSEPIRASIQPRSALDVAVTLATATLEDRPKDGTKDPGGKETPQAPGLADSAGQPRPNDASPGSIKSEMIVGIWSPEAGACSVRDLRRGVQLTVISTDGAWAGDTFCMFRRKQQTEGGWRIVADCSNPRESWTSNVRLSVKGNRLMWTSQRGAQLYARCTPDLEIAQAR